MKAPTPSPNPNSHEREFDPDATMEFPVPTSQIRPFSEERTDLTGKEQLQRDLGPDALDLDEEGLALRRRLVTEGPPGAALAHAPHTTYRAAQVARTPREFAESYPEVTTALLPPTGPKDPTFNESVHEMGASAAAAARRVMAMPGEALQATKEMPGRIRGLVSTIKENTAALMEKGPLTPAGRRIATTATALVVGLSALGGGATILDHGGKPAPHEAVAVVPGNGNTTHRPIEQQTEEPKLQPKHGEPINEQEGPTVYPTHPSEQPKHQETEKPEKPAPTPPKEHQQPDKPPEKQPPKTEPTPPKETPPPAEPTPEPTPTQPEQPQPEQPVNPEAGTQQRTMV